MTLVSAFQRLAKSFFNVAIAETDADVGRGDAPRAASRSAAFAADVLPDAAPLMAIGVPTGARMSWKARGARAEGQ